MSSRWLAGISFFIATTAISVYCGVARGSVVQLTGAGSGDGLSLNSSSVVYALYAGCVDNLLTTTTYTVQGVTFQTESTDFSEFNGFPQVFGYNGTKSSVANVMGDSHGGDSYSYTFSDSGNSDTAALTSIMNGGVFDDDNNPFAATISGLTPNTNYVVDFLMSSADGPSFTETLSLNGTTDDTIGPSAAGLVYATKDTVQSDGSGNIAVSFQKQTGSTNLYPIFNALIVSTPEPTSLSLLAVAASGLAGRRRRLRPFMIPALLA